MFFRRPLLKKEIDETLYSADAFIRNNRIQGVLQRRNHTSKQIRTCNPLIVMIKKSLQPNYRHIKASIIKNKPPTQAQLSKFT